MAVTLAFGVATPGPAYCRLFTSAQSFRQHFRDMKRSNLTPLERFVFSLVLAHSEQ